MQSKQMTCNFLFDSNSILDLLRCFDLMQENIQLSLCQNTLTYDQHLTYHWYICSCCFMRFCRFILNSKHFKSHIIFSGRFTENLYFCKHVFYNAYKLRSVVTTRNHKTMSGREKGIFVFYGLWGFIFICIFEVAYNTTSDGRSYHICLFFINCLIFFIANCICTSERIFSYK